VTSELMMVTIVYRTEALDGRVQGRVMFSHELSTLSLRPVTHSAAT